MRANNLPKPPVLSKLHRLKLGSFGRASKDLNNRKLGITRNRRDQAENSTGFEQLAQTPQSEIGFVRSRSLNPFQNNDLYRGNGRRRRPEPHL